jgi:hypothetical protein
MMFFIFADFGPSKECHANLMCVLSGELLEEDVQQLKQVIQISDKIPKNSLAKCEDFFDLWDLLER